MNTMTPTDKKARAKELEEHHQKTFDALGLVKPLFLPKTAYFPKQLPNATEKHIAFFSSETNKGRDIYLEYASTDNIPEDLNGNQTNPSRTLYVWKYDEKALKEYAKTEPDPVTKNYRVFVPISDLRVVEKSNTPAVVFTMEKEPAVAPIQVEVSKVSTKGTTITITLLVKVKE